MRLIIISNPETITNEAAIINQLFEAGVNCFHLRKPIWNSEKCMELLQRINPDFHPHIALHQHHELVMRINTKRLHYTENHRSATAQNELQQLKKEGYVLSTSVHTVRQLYLLNHFHYVLLSPVFTSISKPDYHGKFEKGLLPERSSLSPQVIALGGINENNIMQTKQMNFEGAAALGAIWNNPEKAVSSFKKLNERIKI